MGLWTITQGVCTAYISPVQGAAVFPAVHSIGSTRGPARDGETALPLPLGSTRGVDMGREQSRASRRCSACSVELPTENSAPLCGRCMRDQRDQMLKPPADVGLEFWQTNDLRAAFESQHIGRVFKAYRHHPRFLSLYGKAINQETLARWLGKDQGQVSRLENGRPEQNLDTLRAYAQSLHIPQEMLWFDLPGQTRINARLASQDASTFSLPTLILPNHRQSTGQAISAAEDPSQHIERLNVARRHFEQMYRRSGGLATAARIDTFLARQAMPLTLIPGIDGEQGGRLQRALGGLIALAGVCAYDAEEWMVAQSRFSHALAIAESSGDAGFRSYVLALMANQALAVEDFAAATRLADLGIMSSKLLPPSALTIDLQTMKAKALASIGDKAGALAAIRQVESAAGTLVNSHGIAEASYAQESHLSAQLAEALLSLGELKAAEIYADRSMASEGHPRGHVNRLASRATLEIAKGDMEGASILACEMVERSRGMDSRRLGSRFSLIRDALATRPTSSGRDAIDRIDEAIGLIT